MSKRDIPHRFSIHERLRSFVFASRGLRLLLREHNTWIHLAATIAVAIAGIFFRLSLTEWAITVLVIGGVWITEALNTAIERICDHVTPQQHPDIAHIKDIAAGAVLLSAITAVIVGLCIFIPHIVSLCLQLPQ